MLRLPITLLTVSHQDVKIATIELQSEHNDVLDWFNRYGIEIISGKRYRLIVQTENKQ